MPSVARTHAQIFQRKPITFPRPAVLPPALCARFEQTLRLLQGQHPVDGEAISARPAVDFDGLTHELSGHFLQRNRVDYKARSHLEEPVAREISAAQWTRALSGDDNFIEFVEQINLRCCPRPPHGRRLSDIQLNADALGATVRFCSPQQAARQLCALRQVLQRPAIRSLYGVMAILVAVTNAHYFMDGNGRTSRVLMNAYCAWRFPLLSYIPFSEIFSKSSGGYEIRLRQAEIHGDWLPLAAYLSDCVALVAEMQTGSEPVR